MELIRQMLLRNGLIANDGSYVTDAILRNELCVCDRRGRVTHRIERSSNGVDLVVRGVKSRLVECRLKLA